MSLRTVLVDAFALLRSNPLLFVPRLALMAASSVLWIFLVGEIRTVPVVDPGALLVIAGLAVLLTPLQVWTYNAYFILVDRHNASLQDIVAAYRAGLDRLPQGIAAVMVPVFLVGVLSLPGAFLFAYGFVQDAALIQVYGALLVIAVIALVAIAFYFVPVAVVLGEDAFTTNFRKGMAAAREQPRAVAAITIASFVLLLSTLFVEGTLKQAGLAGFIIGRGISTVVSVYLLIVNPELYLDAAGEQQKQEA